MEETDAAAFAGNYSYTRLFRNRGAAQPGYFDDVTEQAGLQRVFVHGGEFSTGHRARLTLPSKHHKLQFPGSLAILRLAGLTLTTVWRLWSYVHNQSLLVVVDGWLDLFVIGDFSNSRVRLSSLYSSPFFNAGSQLWWNNGDGTFTDGTVAASAEPEGIGAASSDMGIAVSDFDEDGDLDVFTTDISASEEFEVSRDGVNAGNHLWTYNGSRFFVDRAEPQRVFHGYWGMVHARVR